MRFERLTDSESRFYTEAMDLYGISFPLHEQRRPDSQKRILGDEEYHFNLILEEESLVGAMLCWENDSFIYVEHFCILPKMRSRKYGQRALALLCGRGKPVILEIDPPVSAISVRRRGFYERAGFMENGYDHVHPPYREEFPGHRLVVMSYPRLLSEKEYANFMRYLRERVMGGDVL